MTTLLAPPVVPPRVRTGVVLAILLTAQFMALLDASIVNVAAATIQAALHASGPALQLVLAGYTIAYAVLLITGARIGSLIGFRRSFLLGLVLFTAASAACGLALSTGELIAFRFAQGVGSALAIPQVFSLIQRHFAGPARARALGWYAAVISVGVAAGQILGGVLVSADLWGTGWRPVFMLNVPLGVVLLVVGRRLLPPDTPSVGRGLDLSGLVLLASAVLSLVVPLLLGHSSGWALWCWLLLVASAVLVAGFVAMQRRSATPLMPGRLFRAPGLVLALIALVATMVSYGGYMFTVGLHLQTALGYSPLVAGLSFVPMAASFGVTGMSWQRLPQRWHGAMIPIGLTVAALSIVVIALAFRWSSPALFLSVQVPSGVGSGLAFSPLMARALARVEPADASDASGLVTTNVQLAQVFGVAILGSMYLGLNSGSAISLTLLGCAGATAVAVLASAVLAGRPSGQPATRRTKSATIAATSAGARSVARCPHST